MALVETLTHLPPPLRRWDDGSIRVGGTRVTLDTVVGSHLGGASAVEIVDSYDTLSLGDVEAAIDFYERHRSAIDPYLHARRGEGEEIERTIKASRPQRGLKERLLARKQRQANGGSPTRG
jgi:uncharacterized protein (DUF433 family)